jgi:hypothetical protein
MKQIQTCKLELLFDQVHNSLVINVRNKHSYLYWPCVKPRPNNKSTWNSMIHLITFNIVLVMNISFWHFYSRLNTLTGKSMTKFILEIGNQINGFQRFTVSFIVLMLSNSYRSITKYMSIYTQKNQILHKMYASYYYKCVNKIIKTVKCELSYKVLLSGNSALWKLYILCKIWLLVGSVCLLVDFFATSKVSLVVKKVMV